MDAAPFEPLTQGAALLDGYAKPWCFAGGWAIDLFHGRVRRPHKDIDIAILRKDQAAFQAHFSSLNLQKIVGPDGQQFPELWQPGEWLELPVHQVWVQIGGDGWPTLEVLFNETDGDEWCWRINKQIRCPLSQMSLHSTDGLPFLNPAIVLLFKSRHTNPTNRNYAHDLEDFRDTAPLLDAQQRAWLKDALHTYHPGHHWIDRL